MPLYSGGSGEDAWMEGFKVGYDRGFFAGQVEGGVTDPRKIKKGGAVKRKLSAWNKFVKANAKKPRFRLRSGAPNLKKLGVAFRKTPAGKKKRR
jgi:hypothetical protein